jgi:hypothetical protein
MMNKSEATRISVDELKSLHEHSGRFEAETPVLVVLWSEALRLVRESEEVLGGKKLLIDGAIKPVAQDKVAALEDELERYMNLRLEILMEEVPLLALIYEKFSRARVSVGVGKYGALF